jgi:hypothetical protein
LTFDVASAGAACADAAANTISAAAPAAIGANFIVVLPWSNRDLNRRIKRAPPN